MTDEEIIKEIENIRKFNYTLAPDEVFDRAISAIKESKGEWIHPYRSDIACECSICHMQMPITDYFHYCPNCGADMRGET